MLTFIDNKLEQTITFLLTGKIFLAKRSKANECIFLAKKSKDNRVPGQIPLITAALLLSNPSRPHPPSFVVISHA
jgi:hypothetical protein